MDRYIFLTPKRYVLAPDHVFWAILTIHVFLSLTYGGDREKIITKSYKIIVYVMYSPRGTCWSNFHQLWHTDSYPWLNHLCRTVCWLVEEFLILWASKFALHIRIGRGVNAAVIYSFYHPTGGRRLSQPRWLATYLDSIMRPQTVNQPISNQAQQRVTMLTNMLLLNHTLKKV